jgi:hypothetical protein
VDTMLSQKRRDYTEAQSFCQQLRHTNYNTLV